MSDQISTTDTYEAANYLVHGCELLEISCQQMDGKPTCRLVFTGPEINKLQLEYFNGKACINLFAFRRAYGQINAMIYEAKKRAKKEAPAQSEGGRP